MTHPALIERITRSLAYMLRHQPEEFDLEVDEHGYAEMEDVVQALNERLGEPVEEDDIHEAVTSGDRQRYEIVGTRIRALYGHSIDVQPGEPSKPPSMLYVGVSRADAERASRYGLRAGRRRFLHLALTPDDAIESGRRAAHDYVVITVHALDAWEEGINFYDRRALFLSDPIPTNYMEVGEVHTDGIGDERQDRDDRGARHGSGGRRGHDRGPRRDFAPAGHESNRNRGSFQGGHEGHAGDEADGARTGGATQPSLQRAPDSPDRARSFQAAEAPFDGDLEHEGGSAESEVETSSGSTERSPSDGPGHDSSRRSRGRRRGRRGDANEGAPAAAPGGGDFQGRDRRESDPRGTSGDARGAQGDSRAAPSEFRGRSEAARGGGHEGSRGYESPRGGYDAPRGDQGGARGGYDAPRGGYDAPRGGYDAPRGGSDAPRGGSDAPRGGSDAPRGGYDRSRGGHDEARSGGDHGRPRDDAPLRSSSSFESPRGQASSARDTERRGGGDDRSGGGGRSRSGGDRHGGGRSGPSDDRRESGHGGAPDRRAERRLGDDRPREERPRANERPADRPTDRPAREERRPERSAPPARAGSEGGGFGVGVDETRREKRPETPRRAPPAPREETRPQPKRSEPARKETDDFGGFGAGV